MPEENGAPYPGFDHTGNYETPRRAARVKPEAEEYARKHKGSINLFAADDKDTGPEQPPPPVPKCPTYESQKNYEVGRSGTLGVLLGGKATPRPDDGQCPNARVKPEAQDIAAHHKGSQTAVLFNQYGNLQRSSRPGPRVRVEGEVAASMDMGGRMGSLLHSPEKIPESPKAAPRVKPEAEDNASLGKGRQMTKVMGRYGETPRSMRGVPRVKREGEDNAELDKGGRMGKIFTEYGNKPQSGRPAPRVKSEGEDIANMDKGGRMSRIMHDGNSIPPPPAPAPRATTSAARRILKKNRGNMGQVFSQSSKWHLVTKPGQSSGKVY